MPQKIVVDIHAKRIAKDASIWIVHSGRNKQLLDFYLNNEVVVLEYPGLDLTPQTLGNDSAVRQRLRRSQALRANKGLTRQDGSPILLSQFSGHPDKDVAVALRTVKHLTSRMKDGDLVVAPGKGSQANVLFGEVKGAFNSNLAVRSPTFPYADVPARSVNWISNDKLKRDLPAYLQRYFEKPPAIANVARDQFSELFYDYAYKSYIKGDVSWALIDAPKYDGKDLRSTIDPTSLVIFSLSLFEAVESGDDFSALSFDQIIDKYYDVAEFEKLAMTYNSPGKYPAKARDAIRALFMSAIIGLAAAGSLSACSQPGTAVSIANSEAPNDPANPIVERMIHRATERSGGAALAEADIRGARAKASVDIRSPSEIK